MSNKLIPTKKYARYAAFDESGNIKMILPKYESSVGLAIYHSEEAALRAHKKNVRKIIIVEVKEIEDATTNGEL